MASADFNARQLALIRSARSLESDTRPFDDKINDIWQLLTAAKGGKSCAAEETILRWLLKHMDGTNETAEQLRRYPPTWTTIGCLVERISLFSLSKIFLERKFIVVLQQSAKDISRPQVEDGPKPTKNKKRRRDEPVTFDIEFLRSSVALIHSASELFGALSKLLDRLNGTTTGDAEDILIGAEHIKSLFRVPAEDAKELVAPLLWACAHSLKFLPHAGGLVEQQEQWPKVIIALWDLHLGSAEDSQHFAGHLYLPCCTIIDNLLGPDKVQGNIARKETWQRQVEHFVTKNLVNPARNAYSNGKGLSVLEIANATTLADSKPFIRVLWRLAVQPQRDADDPSSKRARLSWAQSVFKLLLNFAEEQNVAEPVVGPLLGWARLHGCSPELETLSHICKSYCFQISKTDWALLSDIIQCDPDVFLLNETILSTLLDRISSVTETDKVDMDIVEGIINPLMEAFTKARDLIGFIKKWHGQLSQLLVKGLALEDSLWYDRKAREKCAGLLQGALSVQQVSTLVDWLEAQADDGAHLVILDAVCRGVKDEAYIDSLNSRVLNVVLKHQKTLLKVPSLRAIWWHVANVTASWVPAADVHRIWKDVKKSLSKVLSAGSISDSATFEAFGCCSKLCLVNYPHGKDLNDSLKVAFAFLERLVAEVKDDSRVAPLSNYLELVFSNYPILSKASSGDAQISSLIGTLFSRLEAHIAVHKEKTHIELFERVTREDVVQDEEEVVDALIRPLIAELERSDACGWTSSSSESTISTLLTFSPEVFTKDRRKKIMSSWKKWKSEIDGHYENTPSRKLLLRLLIQVMAQPTFYDGMTFDDIRSFPLHSSSELLPLVERLAHLMVSQMVGHVEATADTSKQMVQYLDELDVDQISEPIMPLILLKSMANALKGPTSKTKQALNQEQVAAKLRELVGHSIAELSSKLKKPGKLAKDEGNLLLLDLALRSAAVIGETLASNPIKLSSKVVTRLGDAGETLTSEGIPVGWRLQTFMVFNRNVSGSTALFKQMGQSYPKNPDSQSVSDFVDAVIGSLDASAKLQLLQEALKGAAAWNSPSVPYMIMARILETIQASGSLQIDVEGRAPFDLASVQITLARSLTEKTSSVERFKNTARVLELLLEKHASSMTQVNIEHTLAVVAAVCSSDGPKISESEGSVAGGVFDTLYRLVAVIIKRHRLRLEGHHHLLVSALQALLRVLLADPAKSKQLNSSFLFPPWLDTRLKARHGTKFARLLTLICEPSAASVARGKHNSLDSATDAVKRSAGQHMFWVIALYSKLQLEGDVYRDMRKELATGIYSIMSITPENNRRILNESMDESGRAIFRSLFTEWKKFGKWTGV